MGGAVRLSGLDGLGTCAKCNIERFPVPWLEVFEGHEHGFPVGFVGGS